MSQPNTPTLPEELKRFVKRIFIYWAPVSVILGAFGTLIIFYTIQQYTKTIGRPDLLLAALDEKSAVIFWLVIITLLSAAYLTILITTTAIFGLTTSFLKTNFTDQKKIALQLGSFIALGMPAFIIAIYTTQPDLLRATIYLLSFSTTSILCLLKFSSTFKKAVDESIAAHPSSNPSSKWLRRTLVIILSFFLVATIVSAISPTLLVVKAYAGEDTPEAMNALIIASIISAIAMLTPTMVFYWTKATFFKRASLFIITLLLAFLVSVIASPGGPAFLAYKAAELMSAREQKASKFLISEFYIKEDFDKKFWDLLNTSHSQPVVRAFPLFSFGDLLLLCPEKLINTKRQNWPSVSAICIVTKNSKTPRLPGTITEDSSKKTPTSAP